MNYLIFTILGFLSGSVMYSQILPYLVRNTDITLSSDDGNPGCANVFKQCGIPMGTVCLLCDLFKGVIPVACCLRYGGSMESPLFALVLAAPVWGHASTFCLCRRLSPARFGWMSPTGGKAIAVSFGSLIGLMPKSMLVFALVIPFLLFSLVLKINPHSYRVIVSFGCFFLLALTHHTLRPLLWGSFLISFAVIARHLAGSSKAHEPFHLEFGLRRRKN